ncbi:Adenylosuccinate synthetase [Gossypium arboreum]|uniref:Adenylosuccinate synthetase n=1 Tax=Gossypium arboreum TaxID=29729 RepID=A0A0B0PE03_GOSAR|nr:Adenylosuccinate synthetase [Gossypium arboreum]
MAIEIPKDLITQLQISLRKQANVPSYDSTDPSLPGLPLFHSTSDSPRRRCIHCKSRLLRGSDSILCIFCGKRPTETPPPPIKFQSTSGYRWFLHSLNLDGSENVGESLDGDGKVKGSGEEFALSDILGLEIKWNDVEFKGFESGLRKSNPLNLAGFDVEDDFLVERKEGSASIPSEGTSVVKKGTGFTGSNVHESRGAVSGWQAEFQSDDHGAISTMSFDPFASSSKGISSDIDDAVVGQGTNLFDGKDKGNQTSSESKTTDWFQGDLKSNFTSGDQAQSSISNTLGERTINDDDDWNDFTGSTNTQGSSDQDADGLKSMNEKGGSSADLSTHMDSVFGTGDSFQGKPVDNTTSSHSSNRFQDDLWSNSTSKTVHHTEQFDKNVGNKDGEILANINSVTNDEDSFGAWNDFKSSSILNSSISSSNEHGIHTSTTEEKNSDPFSGWDTDFQSANSKNNRVGSIASDPFAGSSLGLSDHIDTVFASGNDLFDMKAKDSSNASNANSWLQDDLWSNSSSKLTHQAENLGATGDIMDSGKAKSVHNSSSIDVNWFPDDQLLTGNKKAPDEKSIEETDNLFSDWSDFKSSTTKQDPLSDSSKQAITIDDNNDLSAWNDFTSSTGAKDPLSNSSKQTDLFSGAFSNQNGSTDIDIIWPEAPISARMADEDFSNATTGGSKADEIEVLMSQMHDLSFMLETNLSVPTKVDECS